MSEADKKPIFRPLDADDDHQEATEIESLCVNCGQNGITKLLLTKIPFYKEVVLMSFDCEHCGYRNNEIQPGGKIEERGVRITLNVTRPDDLNRQVCKSDHTSVKIPCLDFEIPALSQKGEITTVEGILDRSIQGLEQDQPRRREQDPENADKIESFVKEMNKLKAGAPFTIILEDISGNCFVSNPHAPQKDTEVVTSQFVRNRDQDHALGIYRPEEVLADPKEEEEEDKKKKNKKEEPKPEPELQPGVLKPFSSEEFTYENMIQEVIQFPSNCSSCNAPCQTNMKLTNIPYFKEVVIMATTCDACGHRSNEVKSGGGIEPKGIKIMVTIGSPEDLSRDILKSETCQLEIPELELEVGSAALGGRFTTVEGLLVAMKEQLTHSKSLFQDGNDPEAQKRWPAFLESIDEILSNKRRCTLVLDDPAGNSYVQSLKTPDPNLSIVEYERTFQQNEDLGLNDIKVDNYETLENLENNNS